jgi:hypothetical protein
MFDGVRTGVGERKGSSRPNVLRDALAITDPRTSRSPRHHPNQRAEAGTTTQRETGDGKRETQATTRVMAFRLQPLQDFEP